MRLGFAVGLVLALLSSPAAHAQDAWAALAQPRTHILMRHAEAPGTGDPGNFRLGECSTQRNLSAGGREQASRIGETVRARVQVSRVLTSQWCRASETARLLALGPVQDEPALNSFFADSGTAERQNAAVKARLAALDAAGERAVLVTHQVNITDLTGVFPASGEMLVVRLDGERMDVLGRIRPGAN